MMLQTQPRVGFDRGERGRLGAIVSIVLALHGLAALHFYREGFAFRAAAKPREAPVAIRIMTEVEAPRSPAASAGPSPALARPVASTAPHDKTGAMPNRSRVPVKQAGNTAPTSKLPPPDTAHANPSTQAGSLPAAASTETAQASGAPAASSASHEPQASRAPHDDTATEPIFNAAYLRNPAPDYPPVALRRRWEGTVLLKVHVLANGSAQQIEVIASSGHESLDDAAVQAVTAWRFVPAHRAGQAIDGWVRVPVVFKAE